MGSKELNDVLLFHDLFAHLIVEAPEEGLLILVFHLDLSKLLVSTPHESTLNDKSKEVTQIAPYELEVLGQEDPLLLLRESFQKRTHLPHPVV